MSGKTPHVFALMVLFSATEYTNLGASAMERLLPHHYSATLSLVSETATAFTLWLFLFHFLPFAARLLLTFSERVALAIDLLGWWLRRRLVDVLLAVAARLESGDGR